MAPSCSSSPAPLFCCMDAPAPAPMLPPVGPSSTEAASAAAVELCGRKRWYSILESLATQEHPAAVQQLLADAVQAAQVDLQWAHSGILELLCRAEASAANGFIDSAKKCALGLLDFHVVVQKYRKSVSSSSGSEGKQRSTSGADSSSGDEELSHFEVPSTTWHVPTSAPTAGKRVREAEPVHDSKRKHCGSSESGQATPSHRHQLRGQPLATWAGPVKILLPAGGCVELCRLTMQVPSPLLVDLPAELLVTRIRQRRGLATKGQLTCSTAITADAQQLVELRKMAASELVAVVPLDDCVAIFVPYMAETGLVKAVTFLAALAE